MRELRSQPIPMGAYLSVDAILDAIPTSVVILDGSGRMALNNASWRRFVLEQGLPGPDFHLGGNYLSACRHGWFRNLDDIQDLGELLGNILSGERRSATQVFACHFLSRRRWYRATAAALSGLAPAGIVVMQEDVSEQMRTEASPLRRATVATAELAG